jgi:hypothetical protein
MKRYFCKTLTVVQHFFKPEALLPCKQKLIYGPHPETAEFSPDPQALLL